MTATKQWRIGALSQADRLTDAALADTCDMNEARLLVHGVMARAFADISGPISRHTLDSDLGRALRRRATMLEDAKLIHSASIPSGGSISRPPAPTMLPLDSEHMDRYAPLLRVARKAKAHPGELQRSSMDIASG